MRNEFKFADYFNELKLSEKLQYATLTTNTHRTRNVKIIVMKAPPQIFRMTKLDNYENR